MGYIINIGNAVPRHSKEYGELYARWAVEDATSGDAPTFPHDEVTGNSNSRSPSYTGWHEFCRKAGIEDLWYDKNEGLLREHPGCFILTPTHHARVKEALERWRAHATLPPGFSGWHGEDDGKYDAILARLIWLEWWMDWALKNCETPAVENS